MMRYALVKTIGSCEQVAAYLPSGYDVIGVSGDGIVIAGIDNAGWTLDGYVIPRLASGLYRAVELKADA